MSIFEHYPDYEYLLASSQLALAMLGMGALLTFEDFRRVVGNPRALALGLLTQLMAVPLIAAALGRVMPVEPAIAAGLVLVAAVPGGTMSNVITYLGRGNIALSISLTTITTVGALVTTPIVLRLFIGPHLPPDFAMPVGRVAFEIGVTLLLPLAIGMAFGARFPDWRDPFSRWCIRASITAIGLMVIGAGGSGRLDPAAYGVLGPIVVVMLSLGAQTVAVGVARLGRLRGPDGLALAVEVTVRNTNLALLLKASLFPAEVGVVDPLGDGLLFVALLYGGAALLIAIPPVVLHRRRTA